MKRFSIIPAQEESDLLYVTKCWCHSLGSQFFRERLWIHRQFSWVSLLGKHHMETGEFATLTRKKNIKLNDSHELIDRKHNKIGNLVYLVLCQEESLQGAPGSLFFLLLILDESSRRWVPSSIETLCDSTFCESPQSLPSPSSWLFASFLHEIEVECRKEDDGDDGRSAWSIGWLLPDLLSSMTCDAFKQGPERYTLKKETRGLDSQDCNQRSIRMLITTAIPILIITVSDEMSHRVSLPTLMAVCRSALSPHFH